MLRLHVKNNLLWSAVSAGLAFCLLFGWMLYYAATATARTVAHPRLLGMPVFSVSPIDRGFSIGPDYGILGVPLACGCAVFVLSLAFGVLAGRLTRALPQ